MYLLFFIIIGIVICEALGQNCIRHFHKNNNWIFFVIGLVFYGIICYLLNETYNHKEIGLVNVLWSGLSILMILVLGIVVWDEKITNNEWIGVLFIFTGIAIIQYGGHKNMIIEIKKKMTDLLDK